MAGPPSSARVITLANQKGGVGKTTSAVCLSRAAALQGWRTLLIDMDPQGNATDALAKEDLPQGSVSIADAVLPDGAVSDADRVGLGEVIVPTIWDGVDLAPVTNSDALVKAERLIQASDEGREHRLREALEPVAPAYDVVLIDNAPSLGLLLANSLAAHHDNQVLVVMQADRWSQTGLVRLRNAVERAKRYNNPSLTWGGVLISMFRRTADEYDKLDDVAEHFQNAEVFTEHTIPLWSEIKTSINAGIPLDQARSTKIRVLADTYAWVAKRLVMGKEHV